MTTDSPVKMTHRQVLEALTGLLLGMFVSMIATTVVSTSMPVIVHDLGGDQAAYTWVITATLLTTAISTPIWGKLADLFNRKLLIQIAIIVFVGATAAAGFAQDTNTLIAFRAIQGIGGGGLAALSQVIMADIISPRERGRYMGLFGAVMAVATVGGPLLGGWITDVANWRWNFFVALPFAVAALIILQKTLHISTERTRKVSIDYVGIVLLSAAVSLILIWITNAGSTFDWWSTETVLMVGGAIVSAIAFIIVELKVREPLIPLTLFRGRTFTLSVLASISIGVAMFGTSVYLAQYMQLSRGATPTEAGLMTLPMMAGLLISSMVIGQLVTRFGKWKGYLILGSVLLIAGSVMLSTLHYDTNFVLVSIYMFVMGAGVGMTMQNLVLIVQNVAKPSEMGVASSGVTFFRSLGGTIGVSVMGAVLANSLTGLFSDGKERIGAAIAQLGDKGAEVAAQLSSGTLPEVRLLPEPVRSIIEDFYAQAISHAFLIGIPLAVISLIAILFLPNRPLTTMTTTERAQADAAKKKPVDGSVDGAVDVAIADATALSGAPTTGTVTVVDRAGDRGDGASDARR
ncbi:MULTISPECIES: MDR family MFS transporter [unclassified Microbacterium]|uniref:MDR family MFS transporter n=1 Tax=unclassified Microbacterium TaxID=2609290 RepID=UPI0004930AD2|nr:MULTISPECIES: MDR family MFS transporter [unclassified Microbacterium]MCV0334622.1 MFS transporter [Microbacterium sp.]MCV0376192.1 MFS transporter [Microbacterium sp.]MCV0389751.1 MFS transporter [Microbacterium sp.]MCV0419286.1 MFS transporter [Microbacterium sp.]MCV0421591.1 MFS transporter [Microbacterium sp.]